MKKKNFFWMEDTILSTNIIIAKKKTREGREKHIEIGRMLDDKEA